ncbi:hypothetical protein B7486_45125 [cyanobacterium TDX16]|nr:hypothetical protein B7486_45125 [cyanobacterium TDX16]
MKLLLGAEKVFTVISLLTLTGAGFPRLYEIVSGESLIVLTSEGVVALQIPFYSIYITTFALILLRWRKIIQALVKGKLLLLLVAIAIVSILWSDAPAITLRRSLAVSGATSFGIYLATRYSQKEQLHLLAWTFGIAVLSSILFTIALPAYTIVPDPNSGALGSVWQGIYIHKNVFGRMMTLSTIVLAIVAFSPSQSRYLAWITFSLAVSQVILSFSTSSWIILAIVLALFPLYRALRWNFSWMLLLYIAVALFCGSLAVLITSNLDLVLNSLGKDLTLTGRTKVWSAVIEKIGERPWLGYGYSAFWRGNEGASAYVRLASGWKVAFSHNGLLDLWLDLGFIGVSVYLIGFVKAYTQAITWMRWSKTSYGLWHLILLTFIFLTNFSESTILKSNDIFWVLYTATYFSLSQSSIDA